MISLAWAYVISLLVEWPMIGLLRVAFPKAKRSPAPSQSKDRKENVEEESSKVDPETASNPPSYSSQAGEKNDLTEVSESKQTPLYDNHTFTKEDDKNTTNF